jgi:hypothetical protein
VRAAVGARVDGIVIRLRPAIRVTGKVLVPGTPARECPDATLSLTGPPIGTDDEGASLNAIRFGGVLEVRDVPPGSYGVTVKCPGWIDAPPDTIVVTDRDVLDRTWTVAAGATIDGRVVTRSGAPVPDADVEVTGSFHGGTDATGYFVIPGLPAGDYDIEVHIDGSWGGGRLNELAVAAGATVHHDIVVDDLGSLHAIVVDTRGKPIARRDTFLTREDETADGKDFNLRADTNEGGEVTYARIPAGQYSFEGKEHMVTVQPGRTAEIRLVLPARTGTLRGTLVGPDGRPSVDGIVSVTGPGGNVSEQKDVAADGTFAFDELPDDVRFTVSAYDPVGRSAEQRDVAAGTTLTLKLVEAASVDGTIANAPPNTKLELFSDGGYRRDSRVLPTSGAFVYDELEAGVHTIKATSTAGELVVDVKLAPGAHEHLSLAFAPYQTVSARVVDAVTKAPVPGIDLTMYQRHGEWTRTTDAAGRVTFEKAEPGTATFSGSLLDKPAGVVATYGTAMITAATTEVTVLAYHADYASWSDPGFKFFDDASFCRGIEVPLTVDPKGPAAAAGLRETNQVVAINGHRIDDKGCILVPALLHPPPGTMIELELRTGTTLRFKTVAAPPPANGRVFVTEEG